MAFMIHALMIPTIARLLQKINICVISSRSTLEKPSKALYA